ncbi:MAG: DNA polymerase I, partial [Oscillospiraceae bacterium]|nr:DNA polymerase I [Oscillospiraceae bacterium]
GLAAQLPLYNEYLDLCGIVRYALEGYEADDLLGALGRLCENAGHDCVIVTGDRDAFQLVSERVSVLHVSSRMGRTETKLYTPEVIFETYGLTPAQLIDLKALMGDKSDNIPGVAGVGEKTALDLMRRFGNLETIYSSLDGLTPSLKAKLENGAAYLSRELARIDINAPIELLDAAPPRDLTEFYKKLNFKKFLAAADLHRAPREENEQLSLF